MSNNQIKKIWNGLSTLVTVLLIILTFLLVGVRLLGFTPYAIISGSMEPQYPVGSLVYVKETSFEEIEVGSPITFVLNEDLVVATHRVVEVNKDEQLFTTKGDANNNVDARLVHYNNVLGTVRYSLPYLGYLSVFIKSRKGIILMVSIIIVMAIGTLIKILLEDKNKNKYKLRQ